MLGIERIFKCVGLSSSTSLKLGVNVLKSCLELRLTLAAILFATGASSTAVTLMVTVSVSAVTPSLVSTVRVAYPAPFAFAVGA